MPFSGVLTLVDWKTTGRRPNTTHEEKDVFNALYDHPLQLAAYAAAFNADIAYRRFPAVSDRYSECALLNACAFQVKQCALIQCFEDGSPCEVLLMRDHQVKVSVSCGTQHTLTHRVIGLLREVPHAAEQILVDAWVVAGCSMRVSVGGIRTACGKRSYHLSPLREHQHHQSVFGFIFRYC